MKKVVFLFDGQGAFKPGVGKDLYNRYPKAREIIDKSSKRLGYDLIRHLWGEEAANTNKLTSIAQPAISTVSLAYAEVLKDMGVVGEISLGHSLGEATAIAYCQIVSFVDGISMIQKRGELMEKGGKEGGMMAIVNIDTGVLEAECKKVSQDISEPVVVANINAPNQVVISGSKEGLRRIAQFVAQNKGRGIPLDVGGTWHSPYLKKASEDFSGFLDTIVFKDPATKFYSVVEQEVQNNGNKIKDSLKKQILSQVNWIQAIENLKNLRYHTFLEIGPSRILKDLVAKIDPNLKVESVALFTELDALVRSL